MLFSYGLCPTKKNSAQPIFSVDRLIYMSYISLTAGRQAPTGDTDMTCSKTHSELVYRTGGWMSCRWRVTTPIPNEDAAKRAAEIERMGYKTIVRPAGFTAAIGLPEGWGDRDTKAA